MKKKTLSPNPIVLRRPSHPLENGKDSPMLLQPVSWKVHLQINIEVAKHLDQILYVQHANLISPETCMRSDMQDMQECKSRPVMPFGNDNTPPQSPAPAPPFPLFLHPTPSPPSAILSVIHQQDGNELFFMSTFLQLFSLI